ncbi:MAG: hypothetical protein BGN88_14140 [Clostridiales bacterium 43-6]|nr:MAG: hypothetical protein BGN88_14140 [Clostridiales bacterium 43-6]
MTKKKLAIILAAAVLVISLAAGSTLAYLTDKGDVTNTFTMGNVDIDLTEPHWDDTTDGKVLVPGDTLVKDPVVAATEGDSYMRVKVEIIDTTTGLPITDTNRINLILSTIYTDPTYVIGGTVGTNIVEGTKYSAASIASFAGTNTADFTFDTTRAGDPSVRYYNYNSIFKTSDSDKAVLFTNVVIPTDFDNADLALLGSFSLKITAQAIQSDNFASAAAAFTALDAA